MSFKRLNKGPISICMYKIDSDTRDFLLESNKKDFCFTEGSHVTNQSAFDNRLPQTIWTLSINSELIIKYPSKAILKVYDIDHEILYESKIRIPDFENPDILYDEYFGIKTMKAFIYQGDIEAFNFSAIFFLGSNKTAKRIMKRSFKAEAYDKCTVNFEQLLMASNVKNITGAWTKVEKDHVNTQAIYGSHIELSQIFQDNKNNVTTLILSYDKDDKKRNFKILLSKNGVLTSFDSRITVDEVISLYFFLLQQGHIKIEDY